MRRLCVTNVPLHVRKEDFASIFRPLDGCIECRLVNQDNRPVGFVTFATDQQARNAQEAYNLWQGFGQGGLLIELIATAPQQQMEQPPFQGPPAKRPPPEALDPGMQGPGGYKQMRRDGPGQLGYGGPPRVDAGYAEQAPSLQGRYSPRYAPEPAPVQYAPVGPVPNIVRAPSPRGPQYDEPFPASGPPAGDFRPALANSRFAAPDMPERQPEPDRGGYRLSLNPGGPAPERQQPPPRYPGPGYEPPLLQDQPPRGRGGYAPEPHPGPAVGGDPYGAGPAARPRPAPEPARGPPQYGGPGYDGGYPAEQPPPYREAPPLQREGPPLQQEGPPPAFFDRGPGPQGPEAFGAGPEYGPGPDGPQGRPPLLRGGAELPADARPSLYVESVPRDASRREIAHIFRPFPGYKEVRLVEKPSKINPGETVVIAFVEFQDVHSATEALHALQSYPMDPTEETTQVLRIKYATDRHGRPMGGRGGGRFGSGRGGGGNRDSGGRGRGDGVRGDGGRGRGDAGRGRGDGVKGDGGRGRGDAGRGSGGRGDAGRGRGMLRKRRFYS